MLSATSARTATPLSENDSTSLFLSASLNRRSTPGCWGASAIDFVFVVDGSLDASTTLANRSLDMAAGVVIAREADVAVTDLGGAAHTADSCTRMAATPAILDDVLALLREAAAGTSYDPEVWTRTE